MLAKLFCIFTFSFAIFPAWSFEVGSDGAIFKELVPKMVASCHGPITRDGYVELIWWIRRYPPVTAGNDSVTVTRLATFSQALFPARPSRNLSGYFQAWLRGRQAQGLLATF